MSSVYSIHFGSFLVGMSIRMQHAEHAPSWSQAPLQIQTDLRPIPRFLLQVSGWVCADFPGLLRGGFMEEAVKGVAGVVVAVLRCCEELSRTVDRYSFVCPFRKDE